MYVYVSVQSEPQLWAVGFYAPDGIFHIDTELCDKEKAAQRVHWLNGGEEDLTKLKALLKEGEQQVRDISLKQYFEKYGPELHSKENFRR